MDVKVLVDTLIANAGPIAAGFAVLFAVNALLRSAFAKKLWAKIEGTLFSNWQLALLATTGLVLSLASGYTTWDGMRNFTGEALLSGMITFGIQGVMLIVAWLIGESFATGMAIQSRRGESSLVSPAAQTWLGTGIGILLFIAGSVLVLQWTGATDVRQTTTSDLQWSRMGDKFIFFAASLLVVALFVLYAASDVIRPYIQASRVVVRNSVLWLMFLACMATSVFFSFDSLFASIFPQAERVRAAELRAQNQVAGIVADIEQALSKQHAVESDALFRSEAWANYSKSLEGIADAANQSQGAIERYVNDQIETRRKAVREQQERAASALAGQSGLAGRKVSLTEEKGRLATERPELAADYAAKKADVEAKAKEADAKKVEALAEDKGVEGTGKEGKGPVYRQRMGEYNLLIAAKQVAEQRLADSQKRLNAVESRLAGIDRELATLDGDLAKLKGEAETAEQRAKLAEQNLTEDNAPKLDPARVLPVFERSISEFRAEPSLAKLTQIQTACGDIYGALSAAPETKVSLAGLDCDAKPATDAGSALFALQAGSKVFAQTCIGGDKLAAQSGADALYGFARTCLADSGLPSAETSALRTKINGIELARDDKAHRFVVTWNAFTDGNRLAYLALAIAIAIDSLVFMSGLFGANAVRSPLSDVPMFKARSASQLEATINAALGPHPYDTAWLTLQSLRPVTNSDGFSAIADLSALERSTADRVRMVLTAGADIGAVETLSQNPERYRVRSELREYLSSVCDNHFKSNVNAKDLARLEQLVSAALVPCPRENADLVLQTLRPIREDEGFTSTVTLDDVKDAYSRQLVMLVINAGSTLKKVEPDIATKNGYRIRPELYETLLIIRATAAEAPDRFFYERERHGEMSQHRLEPRPGAPGQSPIERSQYQQIEKPVAKLPPAQPQLSKAEIAELGQRYRAALLTAIELDAEAVDSQIADRELHSAIHDAWKVLDAHGKKNEQLGRLLIGFREFLEQNLRQAYETLKSEISGDNRKLVVLDSEDTRIQDDLGVYMLLPERHLIDYLIEQIEAAAQHDDGLLPGEQALRDQLRHVRRGLNEYDMLSPRAWDEIRTRLASGYKKDMPNFLNKFGRSNGNDRGSGAA